MSDPNTSGAANAPDAEPRAWHVMLDLETLSTRKDAAVFQIAALCFDPETGETGTSFCAFIRPGDVRGHLDIGTLAWWMTQQACGDVARRWQNAGLRSTEALSDLGEWLSLHDVKALWSHGATFDIVVLENQYTAQGLTKPWSYRIERDTRTLYALAYADGKAPYVETDDARKHDAAYDCEVQAQQVSIAWRSLRGLPAPALTDSVRDAIHAAALDTLV
jgi:exodeoxyribonuclease VIII